MNRQEKTLLIVGGAGYIGSHINKMLQRAGYSTLVLDDLSRGHILSIPNTSFIKGNLRDTPLLNEIFKNNSISTVFHFAALSNVGESFIKPAEYYLNNVSYTINLLNAMVANHVPYLIFSSSAAIFGNPHFIPITEDHPCLPINSYGESKLMVEKILKDYDRAYGLKSCCLRYFNAAGGDPVGVIKNYQSQISNLIPLALKNLKSSNKSLTINGNDYETPDGTCIRDYIHLEDLGTAHIAGMQKLWATQKSCEYNLGIGKGYSIKKVLQCIQEVTQKKIEIIQGERRLGDPAVLIADASKARKELNWNPRYCDLNIMIKHAWQALDYMDKL